MLSSERIRHGFTLVELLIVMVIMGLSLTLVGGVTVRQLDNSEQLKEIEQVYSLLEQARFTALNSQTTFEVDLSGNTVTIKQLPVYRLTARTEQPYATHNNQYSFETLFFVKQSLVVNSNGFWSAAHLKWAPASAPERQREYSLPTVGYHYEF